MVAKVMLHMVVGAALGYAYHRLTLPFTGGSCPLVCSPWRAMALGAVFGLLWPTAAGENPRSEMDLSKIGREGVQMSELTITPGTPVHVAEGTFATLIEDAKTPILLDAYADWCAPCRMLAPELEAVAQELSGRLVVAKLDVEANPRLAGELGIRGIPALFLIQNGRLVDSWTGYLPAEDIAARVQRFLPAHVQS